MHKITALSLLCFLACTIAHAAQPEKPINKLSATSTKQKKEYKKRSAAAGLGLLATTIFFKTETSPKPKRLRNWLLDYDLQETSSPASLTTEETETISDMLLVIRDAACKSVGFKPSCTALLYTPEDAFTEQIMLLARSEQITPLPHWALRTDKDTKRSCVENLCKRLRPAMTKQGLDIFRKKLKASRISCRPVSKHVDESAIQEELIIHANTPIVPKSSFSLPPMTDLMKPLSLLTGVASFFYAITGGPRSVPV